MLTIPGRPQAKLRNQRGETLHAGHTYLETVRQAAQQRLKPPHRPIHPTGSLRLDVHLYYGTEHHKIPIDAWHKQSIPNADTASSLVIQALTGILFTHASQVNPLIIHRHAVHPLECAALFGTEAERGATVVTWAAEP